MNFDRKEVFKDLMKKLFLVPLTVIVFLGLVVVSPGPAPNSHDGDPDGPGWSGDWINEDNPGEIKGPAPNAGDGIPDGSGF